MKTYSLNNGDQMPALGLGTWKSEPGEVYKVIRTAISVGYRHFDCAYIYQNEVEIGAALNDAIMTGEVNREELWITSKLWNTHHKQDEVNECLKITLKSLQLDYLDLYLVHWPVAHHKDVIFPQDGSGLVSLSEISLEETWRGMEKVKAAGLAKHIGVSNFSAKKIKQINDSATHKIEVNQVELHPLLQQKDLLAFCKEENIIVTAYSPLGSRDRAVQMKAENEPDLFEIPTIQKIAENHDCSPAQVLIAWAVNRETAVIPKSTHEARLKQNLEAANLSLSKDEMNEISVLDKHFRYVTGGFFALPGSDYTLANLWDE
ncbi:alcohol dehydrogenase (NADP+) [Reichenbachiella faecimaris]|uniref:Alcohol dehydrogenase (NADP+) n=1 Tax=Reichenbachiella faecimaris TaxID=692418 RepID=A0A1W2G8U6_REIFA|nr:aldo/keto reductase [Reichenbachiella faecimaris]SMD33021.1 alcohol dehydrogenase (NADP+) [Reichenbachiella faecimaris]